MDDTDLAVVETEQRETDGSTQELDEGLESNDTDQVKEDHFDDKRAGERDEDGEEEEKSTTMTSNLMSWLRKMWTAPRGTQSRIQHEEEEILGQGLTRILGMQRYLVLKHPVT